MVSNLTTKRKSKFSKRNKKTWRITDIKDVEDFYENKLLEERLGGPFSEKPDDELFFIQKAPEKEKPERKIVSGVLSKRSQQKLRALEPPRSVAGLENTSKVPDPITKRNRVRTKEERKSSIQKAFEEKRRSQGILKKKEILAANNRLLDKKRAKKLLKTRRNLSCNSDIWNSKKDEENLTWLDENTVRHYVTNTGQLEKKVPKSIGKKASALPTVELPHPGTSYNPSAEDHNALLQIVQEREEKMIKADEHLDRVTTKMFKKIPREEVLNNWLAEMSQGLNNNNANETEDEDNTDYKAINPPALLKRKPLKKKKRAMQLKKEKVEKEKKIVEKRKIADLYKLKIMQREIKEKEDKSVKMKEKRKQMKLDKKMNTRRLGRNRFSEPLLEFQRTHELRKNLRHLNPEGNILADRFYSLQRRNVIEPRNRIRSKTAKLKVFKRPGFKDEDLQNDYKKLKLDE